MDSLRYCACRTLVFTRNGGNVRRVKQVVSEKVVILAKSDCDWESKLIEISPLIADLEII
jgi:hypothetical protein